MTRHKLIIKEENSCDGIIKVTKSNFLHEPFNFDVYIERRFLIRQNLSKYKIKPKF